ncbi:DLA class II histocompatibility antigen, DR-1 beta chain-like isoform X2 [Trichosurus vulpecula]|uniref:DLA class II histocompatibility antigen, DR-1 beta chain-like isoform X2 n=1 Tax=Trichosurus vulpecula TaxID=9337 RepID=UPI00186B05E2|nr:DLA class II histocompatibility antigen, DR-1 beta chain-like isoform X2 [Trichosurus vulpecula]
MMCVWTKVLIMTLLLLNSLVAAGRDSPEHFMEQMKLECHFVNGTEHVQFVWRLIYNRQEILRFDSHVGKFVALTELGRPIAELMNSLLEALEQARAQVARCKDNYRLLKSFWMQRKGLISNGDWTFQILVMLEMIPKHGDVYTCQVEHSSLQNPVIVVWEAQSRSAQGKMLSGVGGLVLGLIFLVAGLTVHLRSQKGFEAK